MPCSYVHVHRKVDKTSDFPDIIPETSSLTSQDANKGTSVMMETGKDTLCRLLPPPPLPSDACSFPPEGKDDEGIIMTFMSDGC